MLRYEQIIKEFLEDNQCKLLGIEQEGRILVEVESGEQKIYRCLEIDNTLGIYNVYSDLLYTIELK